MVTDDSFWWEKLTVGYWRCEAPNNMTAEVRQVGENRYLMCVEDRGDEYTGSAPKCSQAMRAAERIMTDLMLERRR